ncbi:hypothetical protein J1785_21805 [Rahnella sp. SL6]|uniref:helix-turn-helix transcriptional regulator n=1 Tax=Rahnella perminowiae TaxID=2816244 RepID=UPI001C25F3CE|nr:hypothetical protein [Rahnella perminowiae]MBU9812352.1 hypothetical protein [Rahnella perminowiae]
MRTTPETNNYIREVRPLQDDGCDYTATIIDRWNCAARARSRVTATPPVKPVPVTEAAKASGVVVKIGNRISYGKRVTMGIYQLHLSGKTDREIARALCMSEDSVNHLLKRGTPSRKSLYMKCAASPLPTESEIMRHLAAESKA